MWRNNSSAFPVENQSCGLRSCSWSSAGCLDLVVWLKSSSLSSLGSSVQAKCCEAPSCIFRSGAQQWHCGRCCGMKNNQDKSLNMIHEQICAHKDKSRTMWCSIYPDDRYSPALSLDQSPTRWYDFFSSNAKYGSIDKMNGILVPNESFK